MKTPLGVGGIEGIIMSEAAEAEQAEACQTINS